MYCDKWIDITKTLESYVINPRLSKVVEKHETKKYNTKAENLIESVKIDLQTTKMIKERLNQLHCMTKSGKSS